MFKCKGSTDHALCGYDVETGGQNLLANYMLGLKGLQKFYFACLILSAKSLRTIVGHVVANMHVLCTFSCTVRGIVSGFKNE